MRRILLFVTDLELGGTPTVVRELALRLRQHASIEVACLGRFGPVAEQLAAAGVIVSALNARSASDLRTITAFVRLVRGRAFDTVLSFLVHANAVAAAAAAVLPDIRWLQSIQTTQPNPRWHWAVQRLGAAAADVVVTPSSSVAAAATAWAGVNPSKTAIIPNAIDPPDFDQQSVIAANSPRPYPIAFLGRLDPIKDVPTLVRAVGLLKGLVHLHVWGDGPDRSRVEASVARHAAAHVTLHGMTADPRLALREAGLLVLPSLAEGFGLVLIEAMASGVPVVASDVPGIRDVVRAKITGLLVPPGTPAAFAAAVRQVVDDAELRERLITAARRDVLDRFTWDRVLPHYLRLLRLQ